MDSTHASSSTSTRASPSTSSADLLALSQEISRLGTIFNEQEFTQEDKAELRKFFTVEVTQRKDVLDLIPTLTNDREKLNYLKQFLTDQPGASVRTLTGSKNDLYIFIDDSNIYIEGKFVIGDYENIGAFDRKRRQLRFDQLRIEYGQVFRVLKKDRNLGGDPIVVGSIPPSDSIWNLVRKEGFKVTTFPRNAKGFEKMVDMQIGHYMDEVLFNKVPATLALVAGDVDFKPILLTAVKLGWKVEVHFWETAYSKLLCEKIILGLSSYLFDYSSNNPDFISLNGSYKSITYGYGPEILYYGCSVMKILLLSGQVINWKIDNIMNFFKELSMFGWWYREHDLMWMFFKNMNDLQKAEGLLRNRYPGIRFQRIIY